MLKAKTLSDVLLSTDVDTSLTEELILKLDAQIV